MKIPVNCPSEKWRKIFSALANSVNSLFAEQMCRDAGNGLPRKWNKIFFKRDFSVFNMPTTVFSTKDMSIIQFESTSHYQS